ncbi:MAG: gliding motility-associated C-terminal domain-containing protein [Flavobacteriales bacterium]|nr:gliding motility-associated C-terminal domain-containing protein [Flavobacteriales bacterium]
MNFLDYTDDGCMNLFTQDQATLMLATLTTPSNNRSELTTSTVCAAPPPSFTIVETVQEAQCNGSSDGLITVSVSGGTTPYTYLWFNGQTNSTVSALSANSYQLTITDFAAQDTVMTFIVAEPAILATTQINTTPACGAGLTGTGSVDFSGGTTPYNYQWSDGQTTYQATGLAAGSYSLTMTDDNSCFIMSSVTIVTIFALSTVQSSVTPTCGSTSDGAASVDFTGTSPYSYVWSDGQTTYLATGMGAGSYTVSASDAGGCSGSAPITIVGLTPPSATVSAGSMPYCEGDNPGLSFAFSGGAPWDFDLYVSGFFIQSYTSPIPNFTAQDLTTGGTYSIQNLSDASGCIGNNPSGIVVTIVPVPTIFYGVLENEGCPPFTAYFNGGADIVGSTINWDFDGDGVIDDLGLNISHEYLDSGFYSVSIQAISPAGCISTVIMSDYIYVYPRPYAEISLTPEETLISDPIVTADASNSVGADSLLWWDFDDPYNTQSQFGEQVEHSYSDTGTYYISMDVVNWYGCHDLDTAKFVVYKDSLQVYNAFSPDGDGINDFWEIIGIEQTGDNTVVVFNRWGDIIFDADKYNNKNNYWDGTNRRGEEAPEGTYFYRIESEVKTQTGWVHLVR